MTDLPDGAAVIRFDGDSIATSGGGRELQIDRRCLDGTPVEGAHLHVCALPDPEATIPFDQPEVQQARRDALAWWIPMLGPKLICISTLAVDESRYGGAVTATSEPVDWSADPFARLFGGKVLRSNLLCVVDPPAGPVIERYAGVAWPGGRFG